MADALTTPPRVRRVPAHAPTPAVHVVDGRERVLDRFAHWDDRNDQYPAGLLAALAKFRSREWATYLLLDQLRGSCVGHGIAGELAADPVPVAGITERQAIAVFQLAQAYDPWWKVSHDGSTVLGGAKAAVSLGFWHGYYWARTVNDVVAHIGNRGPVVVGQSITEGMTHPDSDGRVQPSGQVIGGHCWVWTRVAIDPADFLDSVLSGPNSWGPRFAKDGHWSMTVRDFAAIHENEGEAVVPLYRRGGAMVS
jgi:hypothetical protein